MADLFSILFLASLPILVSLVPIRAYHVPSEYSAWEKMLYAPVYCLARLLWRVEVVGGETLSDIVPGGVVVVANHRCSMDPFFVQLASGRRVHWMVAGEYFRNPVFGPLLRTLKAIPANRSGSDNSAMKTAIRLASEGRYVGMFPEGRINRTSKSLLSIRPGAALVAEKANVPIVPMYIEGAPSGWAVWSALFMASHVRIYVGEPVVPQGLDSADWIVEVMEQSLRLGNQKQKKVELAGRKKSLA